VRTCFAASTNKYYNHNGEVRFSPYHSGQWCIFLYFLANSIFRKERWEAARTLCDKLYFLNKAMNGLDLYYEVEMPDIFFLDHPVGTVMGRAKYSNHFSFGQNCTVGNNKGIFPEIGERVNMMSGSKILGKSRIGNNVIIAANAYIKDQDVPSHTIVFGSSPDLTFKSNTL
jgi:serine O-acetyltransferase